MLLPHLCYLEEYLRLGTLVAQVPEACDCLKLLSIYFDLVDAIIISVSSAIKLTILDKCKWYDCESNEYAIYTVS